jgi:hypothetical protein
VPRGQEVFVCICPGPVRDATGLQLLSTEWPGAMSARGGRSARQCRARGCLWSSTVVRCAPAVPTTIRSDAPLKRAGAELSPPNWRSRSRDGRGSASAVVVRLVVLLRESLDSSA